MIDLSEKVWQNEEVERGLRQLPSLIARKSVEVAEAEAKMKQMKHAIALVEAAATIESSGDKKTATELKARGYIQSAEQHKELIHLELLLELLKSEHQELKDMFDSVRKQANIFQEEMRQSGYSQTRGK